MCNMGAVTRQEPDRNGAFLIDSGAATSLGRQFGEGGGEREGGRGGGGGGR